MDGLDKKFYKLFAMLSSFLMLFMTLLIFVQVIQRYFFHNSLTWSEEVGRYLFVWMTFAGMVVGLYKGMHVTLDIVLKKLHGTYHKTLTCVNNTLVVLFSGTLIYSGIKLYNLGLRQKSSALKIPMHQIYVIIPICGVVLLYFALRKLYKDLKANPDSL